MRNLIHTTYSIVRKKSNNVFFLVSLWNEKYHSIFNPWNIIGNFKGTLLKWTEFLIQSLAMRRGCKRVHVPPRDWPLPLLPAASISSRCSPPLPPPPLPMLLVASVGSHQLPLGAHYPFATNTAVAACWWFLLSLPWLEWVKGWLEGAGKEQVPLSIWERGRFLPDLGTLNSPWLLLPQYRICLWRREEAWSKGCSQLHSEELLILHPPFQNPRSAYEYK